MLRCQQGTHQAAAGCRSWGQWALAGLVPGLVCLVAVPLILYVVFPPEVKDTPDAPAKARCGPGFFIGLGAAQVCWCTAQGHARCACQGLVRPCLSRWGRILEW